MAEPLRGVVRRSRGRDGWVACCALLVACGSELWLHAVSLPVGLPYPLPLVWFASSFKCFFDLFHQFDQFHRFRPDQFSSVQFDQRPPDIRPSSTLTRTAPPHPHTGISTTDKPTPHVRFTPPPPPPPTNRPLNHLVLSPIDSSEIDHPTPRINPPTGTVFSSFLLS